MIINLNSLLEKALQKQGYRHEEISISLSPSQQVTEVATPSEKFTVLLSERSDRSLQCGVFALSLDGIESVRSLKAKYIFFHSQDCRRGILMETVEKSGNWLSEYYDEFDDPIWIFRPLLNPKVYFQRKRKAK